MIRLESVTKRYGAASPAVDSLDLEVPEGTTVALVGPSGCGKTTTLRMINRLIEPSSGRIYVAGEDVTHADPVLLRRRIGYVIQNVGLFPHMTVARNIAAVPDLLGWTGARTASRVAELLDLVGLDEAFAARYPAQLSGGQRQRVGVARAPAADPPVLLMDEPFGAIDPIARTRLQDEFSAILKRVRKTVVIVTHDLDEAVRLGDRLAIMRDGRLVQYDTPGTVLSRPEDAFVEAFVGPDRALKRLSLLAVESVMQPATAGTAAAPAVAPDTNLRDALSLMLASGTEAARVVQAGEVVGEIRQASILAA